MTTPGGTISAREVMVSIEVFKKIEFFAKDYARDEKLKDTNLLAIPNVADLVFADGEGRNAYVLAEVGKQQISS